MELEDAQKTRSGDGFYLFKEVRSKSAHLIRLTVNARYRLC